MRYIRTKDGIEKVPSDYANKLVECPNLVIADTIEELCDEFVIRVKNDGYLLCPFEKALSLSEEAKQNEAFIYGAIWTEWGLKYVAKMNEKGCLELLWEWLCILILKCI